MPSGVGCLLSPLTCAGAAVATSVFDSIVQDFAQGLADVTKALMTFWINTPTPNVSATSTVIANLDHLTRPLVAFAAVIGLVVGGTRLVWTGRHEQSTQSILRGILLMTVVTAAGATLVEALLTGFDLLAKAVLDRGFNGIAVGTRLTELASLPALGAGLLFVLAFFGMIASLVQVGIMLVRGAVLAVLVGVLPVAAGASITEVGYGWFKRLCGWIFSFAVYKLAAAVIYAAAFTLVGSATDLAGVVSGFALLIVAILALPALLRLLPPSAEAMGGGSGGALAGAVAAGATGAVLLSTGRGGSSSPTPTAAPGLGASSGSSVPSGANRAGGASGFTPALPSGSKGGGSPSGAGSSGGGAATGGAAGGATAAAAPVAVGAVAVQQAYSSIKSAATGAVNGEESGR